MKHSLIRIAMLGALLTAAPVVADSITPSTFNASIEVGESTTVTKTVTINAGRPTSAKVDVFFLTDSTGSMGGVINAVKASASGILTQTAGLGDVAFGVGEYKDNGSAFVYKLNQDITTNQTDVQTGINQWAAGGGGDLPEANLFALERVANATAWRSGSTRVVVWFGDAIGHDPSNGVTEAIATAALQAQGIVVEALDVGNLDGTGQATRITNATGGDLFSGINTANVVAQIQNAITAVFANYNTVELDLSGVPAGLAAVSGPAAYNGAFDRSIDRTFSFNLTFTGLAVGVYDFNVNALVDGGIVAVETDHIVVSAPGGGGAVPEPASILLLGTALAGLGYARARKGSRKA